MQNNRFVVLTGHLNNYSLSDLVGILRHQKKTGRLLIEYPKGPATLFFENGDLIDVRFNELTGLQAICVLMAEPESSFNFNPLIRSSQRSIEPSLQRVVSELFGCWDETTVQIEAKSSSPALELQSESPAYETAALPGTQIERLALPPARSFNSGPKSLYVIAAAILIIIGISTVIALTANLNRRDSDSAQLAKGSATTVVDDSLPNKAKGAEASNRGAEGRGNRTLSSEQRRETRTSLKRSSEFPSESGAAGSDVSTEQNTTASSGSKSQAIKVVMQIENGRVLNASIANHASGMDSFEALALRIARQRRYPTGKNGAETVTISVNKPEK